MNKQIKDITGQVFGKLKVIEFSYTEKGKAYWKCKCECGNICTKLGRALRLGKTSSCGCIVRKHGDYNKKIYIIWNGIINRCCRGGNKNSKKYYLNKGIEVCDEWKDYLTFKEWALNNGYKEGLSIERIDNNKGYYPDNCKWIKREEQSLNQTHTRFLEINGVKKPLTVWAKEKGIHHNTLRYRANKGWKAEDLFKKPQ